jgi:hypothetical protein
MTIEDKGRWLFGVNAVINWMISIRGIVDPIGNGARTWRSRTELPIHTAAVERLCLHVWVHVLGGQQAPSDETFAREIQLDRENNHAERSHAELLCWAGAAATDDSYSADELAVDSPDFGVRHRARPSAQDAARGRMTSR